MTKERKEMLEMAAKAVGRTLHYNYLGSQDCNRAWYPDEDYEDAIGLANDLMMTIDIMTKYVHVSRGSIDVYEDLENFGSSGICIAITKVAAEIGKGIVEGDERCKNLSRENNISGKKIQSSWMDEVDQSREYMRTHAGEAGYKYVVRAEDINPGYAMLPLESTEAMVHAVEDLPSPRMYGKVWRAMAQQWLKEQKEDKSE